MLVSNPVIVGFILPERFASPPQEGVRSSCRKYFDRFGDSRNGNARLDHGMDMVGHDAVRDQQVQTELPLTESKGIDDALRNRWVLEPLGTRNGAIQLMVRHGKGSAGIDVDRLAAQMS